MRELLPIPKTDLPNSDFQKFNCSKRLLHPRRKLLYDLWVELFFRDTHFRKLNLDYNEFYCIKRLIRSEKYVRRCLCNKFVENCQNHFGDTHFQYHFRLFYLISVSSIFKKTSKYYLYVCLTLCIKFGFSIFISFGDTKR